MTKPGKIIFATPTLTRPHDAYLAALEASVPVLDAAGVEHQTVFERGCPYISSARATMLRKALDAKADIVVFIDHDLSWQPRDLLTLIETPGDVVAGTYRFKQDEERYMGRLYTHEDGRPIMRKEDGCVRAAWVPAGFLKVTKEAVAVFMAAFPELVFGPRYNPSVDLFNHGAHEHVWWGEDFAFSRRWNECGGEIWVVPKLNIDHHDAKGEVFKGDYHAYLLRQPARDDKKSPVSILHEAA